MFLLFLCCTSIAVLLFFRISRLMHHNPFQYPSHRGQLTDPFVDADKLGPRGIAKGTNDREQTGPKIKDCNNNTKLYHAVIMKSHYHLQSRPQTMLSSSLYSVHFRHMNAGEVPEV